MVNIKVFDSSLTFKNMISNYTDFICERKMSGIGTFTLVINKNRLNVQFEKDDILYIREDSPYIVNEINLVKSVDLADEKYTITGVELKGLTMRRITVPPVAVNLFDKTTITEDAYIYYTDGTVGVSTNLVASDYIVVESSRDYTVSPTFSYGTAPGLAFYDSSYTFISGTQEFEFTTPDTAVYVRFSIRIVDTGVTVDDVTFYATAGERVYLSKSTEYIVKDLIDNNLVSATDTDRNISILSIATNQDRGSTIDFRTRYANLATDIEPLLKAENMGYNVTASGVLDVYSYTDKTASQSVNNRVMFSVEKYKNLKEIEITHTDGKNVGYTGGSGEGVSRIIEEVGTTTGLARKEVFFNVSNVTDTTELAEEGNTRLAEVDAETTIQGTVEQNNYTYLTDYDIGDMITFQDSEFGELDMLITSATEVYSGTLPVQVDLVFNYGLTTLADIIAQNNKNISSTITA